MTSYQHRGEAGRLRIESWLREAVAGAGDVGYLGWDSHTNEFRWIATLFESVVFELNVTEGVITDEERVGRALGRLERNGYPDCGGRLQVTVEWAMGVEDVEG